MPFAALDWLDALASCGVTVVTRLRLDAALYTPAPPRRPGTNGRPRKKGERLPTLNCVLRDKATRWRRLVVPGWYGEGDRTIELATGTCVWYHAGLPAVPIRWVLIRDPEQRFRPQALRCTDPTQEPLTVVSWFVRRWPVEVTFEESRAHVGVESQRQWSDEAIARTTPCLFGLFSLVPRPDDAWSAKEQATFADALAAVRQHDWAQAGFRISGRRNHVAKLPRSRRECLASALCRAA